MNERNLRYWRPIEPVSRRSAVADLVALPLRHARKLLKRVDTNEAREEFSFRHPSSDTLPQFVLDPAERFSVMRFPEVSCLVIRNIQKVTGAEPCLLRQ